MYQWKYSTCGFFPSCTCPSLTLRTLPNLTDLCWSWIKIYFLDSEVTLLNAKTDCWIVFKHSYFLIGLNWRRKPHNLLFGNLDGFYEHYYFHTVSVSVCVCVCGYMHPFPYFLCSLIGLSVVIYSDCFSCSCSAYFLQLTALLRFKLWTTSLILNLGLGFILELSNFSPLFKI